MPNLSDRMKMLLASLTLVASVAVAATWSPSPPEVPQPQAVNVRGSLVGIDPREEAPVIDTASYPATYVALEAAQWPEALAKVSHYQPPAPQISAGPLNRALGFLFPELSVMAPPSVQGMTNYPVAPALEASWSLQGLAEDEQEQTEMVDAVDYGTNYGG